MPTPDPQQQLPSRPNLDHLKYQAQDLRKAFQQGDAAASGRLRAHVSRLTDLDAGDAASDKITAGEAQLVIAREYGFSSWRALKSHVAHVNANADSVPSSDANAAFSREELIAYFAAVRDRDLDNLRQCLQANPALTEARVNEGAMSLRGEAFVDALHQPLTDRTLTAIHQASFSYHDRQAGHRRGDDVIRLLLEYGADPDAIGFDGNNGHCAPIVIASWDGGIETMQLLLEAGADVSGEQGVEALSTCASHDNTERFDLLQEFGAQASPWMLVKAGLSDRVVALIDEDPALLSQTDDDGYTLLQAAAKRMKADGFERLPEAGRRMAGAMIERGAEVDAFSAAAMNDVERLQSLLQADLEQAHQQMKDGNTAVNMAVQARSNDALRVMLEAGVEADTEALRWAARMDYTVACRLLIEHGAQVTDEVTLAAAWRNQDPDCLELVLANGGNPNAADIRGPLHWVAASPQSVQLLIDAGADVNMRTPGGTLTTPLHHAANNADSTQRLLAAGADPTLADANGDTPLDLAERDGAQEVVAMLRPRVEAALAIVHANDAFSHDELATWFTAFIERDLDAMRTCLQANSALTETRINDKVANLRGESLAAALREPLTVRSSTIIHLAANNRLDLPRTEPPRGAEAIQLLLGYGADPDAVGFNENTGHCTAIVIAAWIGGADPDKNDPEKLRLLLEAGADASGDQGIAALSTAASHDRINHFDLLVEYGAQASPWMLVRAGLTDRVLALVDEDPAWLSRQNEEGYLLVQGAVMRMQYDEGPEQTEGRRMAVALIERGAEVDVFTASALDDVELLQLILQADPEQIRQRTVDGRTAVHLAVLAGSSNTLALLLEAGADADEEAIVRATRMDDVECCRLLIEHGAPVNDRVMLSAAWRNQDPACLELVLANGANPSANDGRGTLHWVAAENPQSVQLLIDAGADVNMRASGNRDSTPLHHAIGNIDSTTRLLAVGADPTLGDDNGDTPLDLARRDGAQDVIEALESHIANTAQVRSANAAFSHDELVAYFDAFRERDLDALRAILDANPALTEARANDKVVGLRGEALDAALRESLTVHSSTAIHLAANNLLDLPRSEPPKGVEAIRLLLEYGADPDAMGYNENQGCCTSIVIAAWIGSARQTDPSKDDPVKLRLLLEAGADATGEQGIAALSTAASHDRINHFDLLAEYGAPATPWLMVLCGMTDRVISMVDDTPDLSSSTDDQGYTLMQAGAQQLNRNARDGMRGAGRVLVEALIARGVEVDVCTAAALNDEARLGELLRNDPARANQRLGDGKTPIDFAVRVRSRDTLRLLLQSGADPNLNAPLKEAARRDDTGTCRILIEHGALVTDQAVLAAAWGNQESACLALMLDNGGNASAVDGRGTLHWVAGNPQSVQLLIDAGADVNMRASGNRDTTPLHHAVGNIDSLARLLAAGADPTLDDANGDTPLDLAQRRGLQDVVELLNQHIDASNAPDVSA